MRQKYDNIVIYLEAMCTGAFVKRVQNRAMLFISVRPEICISEFSFVRLT